jgi:hypothetical protein
MAVGAIGSLGPAAGEALPDVVRLGRTTPSTVERMGVARVLGEIGRGSREAEALLREWAADADPFLRPAAEAALKKLTARPVPK